MQRAKGSANKYTNTQKARKARQGMHINKSSVSRGRNTTTKTAWEGKLTPGETVSWTEKLSFQKTHWVSDRSLLELLISRYSFKSVRIRLERLSVRTRTHDEMRKQLTSHVSSSKKDAAWSNQPESQECCAFFDRRASQIISVYENNAWDSRECGSIWMLSVKLHTTAFFFSSRDVTWGQQHSLIHLQCSPISWLEWVFASKQWPTEG